MASLQVKDTVGAPVLPLNQPLAAGDLSSDAEIVGAVASRLIVTVVTDAVPPALVAEQV